MATIAMTVRIAADMAELKKNLSEGKNLIETTTAASEKLGRTLGGERLIQSAHNYAAAVEKIGGVTKLTAVEKARVNALLEKALDKYRALGHEAPLAMRQLAEATRAVEPPTQSAFGSLTALFGAITGGVAVGTLLADAFKSIGAAVTNAVGQALQFLPQLVSRTAKLGDQLFTMSQQTKLSVEALSAFKFVAGQADTSLETITGGVFKMQVGLAKGGNELASALKTVGLSLADVRQQRPEEAFLSIMNALHETPNAANRAAAGVAIFGKSFKEFSQLAEEDLRGLMAEAQQLGVVMTTETAIAADRYTDALDKLSQQAEGLKMRIGAALLPAVVAFTESMQKGFVAAMETSGLASAEFAKVVDRLIVDVGKGLAELIRIVAYTADAFMRFFAGDFIRGFALVELIADITDAVLGLAKLLPQPFGAAGAVVEHRVRDVLTRLHTIAQEGVRITATGATAIHAIADATAKTAAQVGKNFAATYQTVKNEIATAAEEMRRRQKDLGTAGLLDIEGATQRGKELRQVIQGTRDLADQFTRWPDLLPTIADGNTRVRHALAGLTAEGLIPTARAYTDLEINIQDLNDKALAKNKALIDAVRASTLSWDDSLSALAQSFVQLAQISNGRMSAVARGIGSVVGALDLGTKATKGMKGGFALLHGEGKNVGAGLAQIGTNVMGMVSAMAQATSQGNTLMKTLGGVAAGAQMGAQFGPIGAAIGAAAGGVIGLVRGLFGKEEGKKVNDLRDQFISAAGGLHALNVKAFEAGLTLDRLLAAKKVKDFEAAIKGLEGAFAVQAEALKNANTEFGNLLASAQTLGVNLPKELQPAIQHLIDIGKISKDNAGLFASLSGSTEVDFKKMQEVARKYGVDLASLGPHFQSARLSDLAKTIINDFDLLTRGGADVGGVLFGMRDEIGQLVTDSLKFGTTIPENMKPWIEELARSGNLIDESGKKISDVSGLKFAPPMVTEFDKILAKLQDLIDRIAGPLTTTIANIPNPAVDVTLNAHWNIPDPPDFRRAAIEDFAPDQIPGFQHGTHGRFLNFGSGTLAMLHGQEAVVRKDESLAFAREMAGLLKQPASDSGAGPTIIVVRADGATPDAVVRQVIAKLPRAVAYGGELYSALRGALGVS